MIYQPGRGPSKKDHHAFQVKVEARLSWVAVSVTALWLACIFLNICGWVHRHLVIHKGPFSMPEYNNWLLYSQFPQLVVPIVAFYCIWSWVFSLAPRPHIYAHAHTHTDWYCRYIWDWTLETGYILSLFPCVSLENKEHLHVQNVNHTHNTIS